MTAKFAPVLRWTGNGVLKVQKYLSASISIPPCPQSNFFVNNLGYEHCCNYFFTVLSINLGSSFLRCSKNC